MKKPKPAEAAAEKFFDKWWDKEDRYYYPLQLAVPEAFLAGAAWQKRRDLAAVRAVACKQGMRAGQVKKSAIDAIKKGGGK